MDWLRDQFLEDPWVTPRFIKYQAGPKRWPFKNQREIKRQYHMTFATNFMLGALLTWPLAILVGRRAKYY